MKLFCWSFIFVVDNSAWGYIGNGIYSSICDLYCLNPYIFHSKDSIECIDAIEIIDYGKELRNHMFIEEKKRRLTGLTETSLCLICDDNHRYLPSAHGNEG